VRVCGKCSAPLEADADVVYVRRVGIFCPTCAPTNPEEIRALRQDAADAKAKKTEAWLEKRKTTKTWAASIEKISPPAPGKR
jgi:hypothetical protein